MGTDIYLSWDDMTKEEKDGRITGYDIFSGHKGYLRASIGMVEENKVLRAIFSDVYWKPSDYMVFFQIKEESGKLVSYVSRKAKGNSAYFYPEYSPHMDYLYGENLNFQNIQIPSNI